jgi:hypothetical protein
MMFASRFVARVAGVAAALVLVTSDASKMRAALIQGTLPAIGLVLLLVSR